MNDLHTHPTYKRSYEKFSRVFINSFCYYRGNAIDRPEALVMARKEVAKSFAEDLKKGAHGRKLIALAYKNVCGDLKLVQKAIDYYRGMEKVK